MKNFATPLIKLAASLTFTVLATTILNGQNATRIRVDIDDEAAESRTTVEAWLALVDSGRYAGTMYRRY